MQLLAIVRKELMLLFRDIHGLTLLFIMPVVFILIMSLAMKQDFDRRSGVQLEVLVDDRSQSSIAVQMLATVSEHQQFKLLDIERELSAAPTGSRQRLAKQAVGEDRYSFLIRVSPGAFVQDESKIVDVLVAPGTSPEMTQLFLAILKEAIAREKITLMFDELKTVTPALQDIDLLGTINIQLSDLLSVNYGFQSSTVDEAPTAVQQNVPAWLVFSMFFVVVPLANTLINERQLGTLRRIRTISVPGWMLIAGKIIPYFFINQIQVILMLLVGIFLVPLLGGDRLSLGDSTAGLALMSAALSIAALGCAMLVAVICRSTEQATTLGGAGNIILAALGGIMVPTFIMPEFMQSVATLSPMSWGLQGFLDILLRGGGVIDIWPKALSLVSLGVAALSISLLLMNRQKD